MRRPPRPAVTASIALLAPALLLPFARPVEAQSPQTRTVRLFGSTAMDVERAGSVELTVALATSDGAASSDPVSVTLATADGSALAGTDYSAVSTSVDFPAGSPDGDTRTVPVPLLDDSTPESTEQFTATLSASSGADLGPATVTVTLIDDEDGAIWIGGGSTDDWSDPANWLGGQVPGATDFAFFDRPLTPGTPALHLATLDASFTIGGLVLGDGGDVEAHVETSLRTLTVDGPVLVKPGSRLTVSDGGKVAGSGDHQIDGTLSWPRGNLEGTGTTVVGVGGSLLTPTTFTRTLRRALLLESAATFQEGGFSVFGGALTISEEGRLTVLDGLDFSGLASDEIRVDGTLTIDAGAGETFVTPRLVADGLVEVLSGELDFQNGGTSNGIFRVGPGATMEAGSGFLLTSDGSIEGDGDLVFSGSTMTIEGSLGVTGTTTLATGTTRVQGPTTTLRRLVLDQGTLDGSADLHVTSVLEWRGSSVKGTGQLIVDAAATALVEGTTAPSLDRPLEVLGAMEITSPSFGFGPSGGILVGENGVLDLQGDVGDVGNGTTADVIEVQGELRKSAGAGEARITAAVDNHGLVRVLSGRLDLQGGGSSTGRFEVPTGTTLEVSSSGPTALGVGSEVDGAGNLEVSGRLQVLGSMTVAGTTTVSQRLTLDGPGPYAIPILVFPGSGRLEGSADARVAANLTCDGCRLEGDASLEILAGAAAALSGTVVVERPVSLAGAATLADGALLTMQSGGRLDILAGGSLELLGDAILGSQGVADDFLTNAGLLRKSGGTGFASLQATFTSSGRVELLAGELRIRSGGTWSQADGTTVLAGGVLGSEGPALSFDGGELVGEGTVAGDLVNVGATIAPGPETGVGGALSVTGNFTQQAGGSLFVQLAGPPGTDVNDLLDVTGAATLDGTLEVASIPPFVPTDGDSTTVLTAASVAGDFAGLVADDVPFGTTLTRTVGATEVVVTATVPPNPFGVAAWSVDGGGDRAGGGDFSLLGAIGQPDAGPVHGGGDFALGGGLWGSPAESAPPETPIFADGFESGDVSAWSSASGGGGPL